MPLSKEVKLLFDKWDANNGWPKRLEWLSIKGVRGWQGERIDFNFPLIAIVGENGTGKSTVLQAAASVYKSPGTTDRFASDFFPDTAWDTQTGVELRYSVREGESSRQGSVRKPSGRWRGNPERRERAIVYMDLSRLQPVSTRVGYARIARAGVKETSATLYSDNAVKRLTAVLGRSYTAAKSALSSVDKVRQVTVLSSNSASYSGFHQGAGEMTIADMMSVDFPANSLVLIDEIETALHPRAQRRLVRDLASIAREKSVQFIFSTHSPYVLEELPERARIQISNSSGGKTVLRGVTPYFAMTKMDDVAHYEAEIFVEDEAAKALVEEVLAARLQDRFPTILVTPCGPASVAKMLGQMKAADRFARPTSVFLDADQEAAPGCEILPGDGLPPEKLVFEATISNNFGAIPEMLKRDYSEVASAISQAVTIDDHHKWVKAVSNAIRVPEQSVWQAMVADWVSGMMTQTDADKIVKPVSKLFQ
ncbi:AAA domain-containing protein [Sphingomonas palmae]|uniref:AAA domain-containing protein n=1 Tax=Sphingomonas palmae TaxID=1855283 RepID=A0A1H7NYY7_9SPHN|nr:AAA family ATPase [Sphingomonas palmae]SEL28752.1 AAA domain-containing protein [Sphingomonas palmae]